MKELVVLKRLCVLEEICREVHMDVNSDVARQRLVELIDSGGGDLPDILASIDGQIEKAKEEDISRKEILDKVDKWRHAKEEEKWLDDYEKHPLLQTLEEDIFMRAQREEEKRQFREQKRLQGQLATEKEAMYGSKSAKKKPLGPSLNTDHVTKTPIGRRIGNTPGRSAISGGKYYRGNAAIPLNYVALQKED